MIDACTPVDRARHRSERLEFAWVISVGIARHSGVAAVDIGRVVWRQNLRRGAAQPAPSGGGEPSASMSTSRRPTVVPPGRKRAPVRRLLTEEQRKEALDAFELFDIVRSASAVRPPG
jgi:hypothetical protein